MRLAPFLTRPVELLDLLWPGRRIVYDAAKGNEVYRHSYSRMNVTEAGQQVVSVLKHLRVQAFVLPVSLALSLGLCFLRVLPIPLRLTHPLSLSLCGICLDGLKPKGE